jgi:tetratricopeptide (TPR) repeat protein
MARCNGLFFATLVLIFAGGTFYQYQQLRLMRAERDQLQELGALRQQLEKRRADGREALRQAQIALASGTWAAAENHLTQAQTLLADQPSLADLLDQAHDLQAHLGKRQAARQCYEHFQRRHDDALRQSVLWTAGELSFNLTQTRQAIQAALDATPSEPDGDFAMARDPSFTDREKQEITDGRYELLVILAEIVAHQDRTAGPAKALGILDQADRLLPNLREADQLRARLMDEAGNPAEARKAQDRASARPATALDHFLASQHQLREGKVHEAILQLRQALRLRPDHFWAQYFLATGYLRQGSFELAQACLTACLGQNPKLFWCYVLRGYAYGQLRDFEAAEADFQQALRLQQSSVEAYAIYVNRGVMRRTNGELEQAAADFEQARKVDPEQLAPYANLAKVHQTRHQYDLAGEQLDKALKVADRLAQAGRIEASTLAPLYVQRARLNLERGRWQDSLDDFDSALRIPREPTPAARLSLAMDHVEKGRLLLRQPPTDPADQASRPNGNRRQEAALRAFDAALTVDPACAEAYRARGDAFLDAGRFDEAVRSYDHLLKISRPDAEALRQRARAHVELRRFSAAIDDYTRALLIKPDATTLAARGWAYLSSEAPRLALDDFEATLRVNAVNGDAHAGRGFARARLGRYQQAVADAEEALRQGPRSAVRLVYNVARVYVLIVAHMDSSKAPANRRDRDSRSIYQDRALALLGDAVTLTPAAQRSTFWRECIEADAVFDAIRHDPRYVRLAMTCAPPKSAPPSTAPK